MRSDWSGVKATLPGVALHQTGMPRSQLPCPLKLLLQWCNVLSADAHLPMRQVDGQLAAFAEQVGASAPQAAAACREVLASGGAAAGREATHSIRLSARRSYRMPEHGTEGEQLQCRLAWELEVT